MSSISRFPINFFQSSLISSSQWRTHILKENTSNMMCASLLQFSMVGFSVCISSRNLIIANFSRCVRSLFSETHLTLYFYLNVIAPSIAQASLHQNDWHIVDILRCQSNKLSNNSTNNQWFIPTWQHFDNWFKKKLEYI
jgi:hypothetical protein